MFSIWLMLETLMMDLKLLSTRLPEKRIPLRNFLKGDPGCWFSLEIAKDKRTYIAGL